MEYLHGLRVGLWSGNPLKLGKEVAYAGYQRQKLWAVDWGFEPLNTSMIKLVNSGKLVFPTPTGGPYSLITHVVLVAGMFRIWDVVPLSAPHYPSIIETVYFGKRNLSFTMFECPGVVDVMGG